MNQTAQGLASLGRGPDSMLVHMAPGEVKSLQQLAMAHGGSLTINPETGLPEAGFLSSILPMVLGAGAMMIPGLQGIGAAGIGLGLGGLEALRTGSLKKGLMAGLGAYGGAGLGSALAGAGASTAGATAGALGVPGAATGAGSQAAMLAAQNQGFGQAGLNALGSSAGVASGAAPVVQSGLQSMGAGAQGLLTEPGRSAFMQNIGGAKGLMQSGLAAAAPMLMETTTKQPEIKSDANMGQRYQYSPGTTTPTPPPDVPGYGDQGRNFGREQRYFNPTYTPIDNEAARKLHGYAYGGPVENMSNGNDMAAYMGQDKFAGGGGVDSYTYDPVTQMYVKKSGEGATMVSPTGGISGASAGSGYEQPLNPKVNDYLTWEETTPEGRMARDARMEQVQGLFSPGPLGAITQALTGRESVPFDLNSLLGTPQAYTDYQSNFARGMDPMSGPGTIGSRDTRGSNEPSPGGTTSDSTTNSGSWGDTSMGGSSSFDSAYSAAKGGLLALAQGGISHLGDYSDGGRLLRGPGDGISDSIPAMIGKKQPARLADGEFVVPARIVSELGNGSTEAGARKLYAMMDRIQKARGKTIGKGKVAANSRSAKYLPA